MDFFFKKSAQLLGATSFTNWDFFCLFFCIQEDKLYIYQSQGLNFRPCPPLGQLAFSHFFSILYIELENSVPCLHNILVWREIAWFLPHQSLNLKGESWNEKVTKVSSRTITEAVTAFICMKLIIHNFETTAWSHMTTLWTEPMIIYICPKLQLCHEPIQRTANYHATKKVSNNIQLL